jgi:serine protein kinase
VLQYPHMSSQERHGYSLPSDGGIGLRLAVKNGVHAPNIPIDVSQIRSRLSHESEERKHRLRRINYDAFLEEAVTVENEKPNVDYVTASGLLRRAIDSQNIVLHPSGRREFTFFSHRTDRNQVIGNLPALEEIYDFLASQERGTENKDRILLIVGKSGSGKSTAVDALKKGFEEYSESSEIPIRTLVDCPINENPLHVLQPLSKDILAENIPGETELCPDCKDKLQKDYDSDYSKFNVAGIIIDSTRGIGITKLDPDITNTIPLHQTKDLIMPSNRGILEISEYPKHNGEFRKAIGEMMTSKHLQVLTQDKRTGDLTRREYKMDHVVIATATFDEWVKLQQQLEASDPGELRRIRPVFWEYATSISDEVAIYQKSLNQVENLPHLSPQSLELLAEVAVRTRLKEVTYKKGDEEITVDKEQKLALYDGENTQKLTQQDRQEIERLSRDNTSAMEGMDGLPPTFMTEILSFVIARNAQCITPLDVFREASSFVVKNDSRIPKPTSRKDVEAYIEKAKDKFNITLIDTVRKAFRPDYDATVLHQFRSYLSETEIQQNPHDNIDPRTEQPKQPDLPFINAIEQAGEEVIGKEFKSRMNARIRELARQGVDITKLSDIRKLPELQQAIEANLRKVDNETMKKNLLSADKTVTKSPNAKQLMEREEVQNRLITEYGFCPCCAGELLKHAANEFAKQETSKK